MPPNTPKERTHKDPNGKPSATELGAQKAWLRAQGFTAAQAAKLSMGKTRRENAAEIASWNRAAGS